MSEYKPQDWDALHDERHDTWCVADNTDAVAYLWHLDEESHMRIALHEEHAEQHARLIAAAPDLLAACEDMLEKIDRHYPNDWQGTKSIARATIAKATGATP